MRTVLAFALLIAVNALAAVETFEFTDESQRLRYQHLIDELRCPKCQNQNLAGSDAPIAHDLRSQLYRLLREGRSDAEIQDYMVTRYGDYILYRPPLRKKTVLLWASPFGLLLVAAGIAWRAQRRRRPGALPPEQLSDDERFRLERLLNGEREMHP